ncbi:hypothetical protein ACS0TY_012713 [Phlomoides rotata]
MRTLSRKNIEILVLLKAIMHRNFKRSGQTISKYFHGVLHCVLKLHSTFLVEPQPVPDDSSDPRWGKFKGCLGALDDTYIDVLVPTPDKDRYRNRKGHVSVNVLGVCDKDMKFVYVLTGWEGYAVDSRVLHDAINRTLGLRVPRGAYYLCDNGYPNCEGFLTPYKGVNYTSRWTKIEDLKVLSNEEKTPKLRHGVKKNLVTDKTQSKL